MMRALILEPQGKGSVLRYGECAVPAVAPDEVLVRVAYAGINHVDLLQTQGRYPLPDRLPAVSGMEFSGRVETCGDAAHGFEAGQEVCGLVREGAFAEYVAVKAGHLLPVPEGMDLRQAGGLPESCFTAWMSLFWQARLRSGETLLVHGGTGAVASMAIQMARAFGITPFATAGTPEKCQLCHVLGAEYAIHYPTQDFVAAIKEKTHGRGVDAILDMVGGDYLPRNLEALARGGRLAIIAFAKGAKGEVNLGPVLLKQLEINGATLRARTDAEKTALAKELKEKLWPYLMQEKVKPLIDSVIALEDGAEALERLQRGLNIGKILLKT